jgi:hypothetical protein
VGLLFVEEQHGAMMLTPRAAIYVPMRRTAEPKATRFCCAARSPLVRALTSVRSST